jgi:Uma2 family endonuclease
MPISEKTFKQVALEDPEGHWELHCGMLRRKPGMTYEHNYAMEELNYALRRQLDPSKFEVRSNAGRVSRSPQNYYIPDVFVLPAELTEALLGHRVLETYSAPLPLVVEIWSPSTGDFDVETRLGEYQRRGDQEIWRLHPYERTLTAWRRQPDASYLEHVQQGGTIQPIALPGVTIDLDALFRSPA